MLLKATRQRGIKAGKLIEIRSIVPRAFVAQKNLLEFFHFYQYDIGTAAAKHIDMERNYLTSYFRLVALMPQCLAAYFTPCSQTTFCSDLCG